MRTIKISINTKLVLFIITLLFLSITTFLLFTLNLYKNDKTAYIFESGLSYAVTHSNNLQSNISQISKLTQSICLISNPTSSEKNTLAQTSEMLYATATFDINKKISWQYSPVAGFDTANLISLINPQHFDLALINNIHQFNITTDTVSLFTTLCFNSQNKSYTLTTIDHKVLLGPVLNSKVFHTKIVNPLGRNINSEPELSSISIEESAIESIINMGISNGVKEVKAKDQSDILVAFSKVPTVDWYIIAMLPKSVAFKAITQMILQSTFFAIFLASLAVIIGIFLARQFTAPILKLLEGTKIVANKKFDQYVVVNSSDEVGVLTDSFNLMVDEIRRYMEEVKEKARMENELQVAQLVQTSFYPKSELVQTQSISFFGLIKPASECGGDWWGHFETEESLYLFVGDATGHGVPAALITATANSAVAIIQEQGKNNLDLLDNIPLMMELLNKAIFQMGGKILMTFFFLKIDKKTLEATFANASHNPPYIFDGNAHTEPTKDAVSILQANPGKRLGQDYNSSYETSTIQLKSNDVIVLCTDGIIEGKNPEDKQYGERRFIKSLISHVNSNPEIIVNELISDAEEFYQGVIVDDDLTLISIKIV